LNLTGDIVRLFQIMRNIKNMDSSLDSFINDTTREVENLGGKILNNELMTANDGWLVKIYYIKESAYLYFIFACINKDKQLVYAVTSENNQCPSHLTTLAKSMYDATSAIN
jgi:uncharacterized circularly permuted ATP-grasp superfamily protein